MIKPDKICGMTSEELTAYEGRYYTILAGEQFFSHNKEQVFTKRQAIYWYNRVREKSEWAYYNGNSENKIMATKVLNNLRVLPLRIH